MFKGVLSFLVAYICLVKSAIVIEEDFTNSALDEARPETINDISFGSVIDAVTDFVKSGGDANINEVMEGNKPSEEGVGSPGNSVSSSGVSFPNFDFELPELDDDDQNYYYYGDDDDTFYYAKGTWYHDPVEEPAAPEPVVDIGGGTVTIELPSFGSNAQPPTGTSSSASHPASDASVSSAVNSMFSTPHSNEYQQIAYDAMSRVRSECKADFEDTCTPRSFSSFIGNGIFSLLSSSFFGPFMTNAPMAMMVPRARRLLAEPVDRMFFLNKLKSHIEGVKHELTQGAPNLKPRLDEMASKFAAFRDAFPKKHIEVTMSEPDAAPLKKEQPAPLKPIRSIHLLQGEMAPTTFTNIKQAPSLLRGNAVKRHLDEAEVRGKPCEHNHPDHAPHGMWRDHNEDGGFKFGGDEDIHPWEDADENYNGELLWGPTGDRCMYDNFDSLSQGCKDAITDVYVIRNEYMEEEDESRRGNVAIFWFFVIAICLVAFFRRNAKLAKYEKDLAMYNAMQENPALKEQMEKASGVVMDKPKMRAGSSCGIFVLRLILSFLCALLALQFAFFVTLLVVENNITYDQYGNEVMPPPIVPFLTFCCSLLMASAVMLCVHQQCFGKKRQRQQEPESQQATNESRSTTPNWSFPDMHIAWPSWMTRARPSSRDYAVLAGDSVHGSQGNEMVVITPSAPAPQAVVVQQTYPSTAAVISPVNVI